MFIDEINYSNQHALGSAHEKFDVWNTVDIPTTRLGLIHGSTKIRYVALLDSDVDLFKHLTEGIRFGTWEDRRLNWA